MIGKGLWHQTAMSRCPWLSALNVYLKGCMSAVSEPHLFASWLPPVCEASPSRSHHWLHRASPTTPIRHLWWCSSGPRLRMLPTHCPPKRPLSSWLITDVVEHVTLTPRISIKPLGHLDPSAMPVPTGSPRFVNKRSSTLWTNPWLCYRVFCFAKIGMYLLLFVRL